MNTDSGKATLLDHMMQSPKMTTENKQISLQQFIMNCCLYSLTSKRISPAIWAHTGQWIITVIGSFEPFATRVKMKSRDQHANLY